MKSFLEEYGFAILAAIVVILLIAMATPVGNTIKQQVIHVVQRFSRTADKKLQSDNDNVSVVLSKDLRLNITSKSSTDKFDYIIHYKNGGNELSSEPRSYDNGFVILENCDASSEIYIEVIDLGTNNHYYSNVVKTKDKHVGMNENQVSYIVRHHWQNITDDNYTLHETETKIANKNQVLDLSLTKKEYEGFNYKNASVDNNAVTETVIKSDGTTVIDCYYNREIISFDLNGYLDGALMPNMNNFGTASVKINNIIVASNVSDFYKPYRYGSTYEVYDIKALPGHIYKGVHKGVLKGVITGKETYHDGNKYIDVYLTIDTIE